MMEWIDKKAFENFPPIMVRGFDQNKAKRFGFKLGYIQAFNEFQTSSREQLEQIEKSAPHLSKEEIVSGLKAAIKDCVNI